MERRVLYSKLKKRIYWTIISAIRFLHNILYYRHIYLVDKENIPPVHTPLLIVSNHQNALNDPLGILFSFKDRVVTIFTRADIFKNRFVGKILRSLYLLPAYRLNIDGEETLRYNNIMFKEAGNRLLGGHAVAIFPEGINQTKRWLGDFSSAYLKMAFETAERDNFEKDIMILPMCNHYSDYFAMRSDMMLKFGKPISLKPYYDLYKEKPRTAQRTVNHLVRQEIEDLMLNITDLDNYEAIDYLRNTYGIKYAQRLYVNPNILPDKLVADKKLVAELDRLKTENPELSKQIYDKAIELKSKFISYRIKEEDLDRQDSRFSSVLMGFAFVLLLPVFVISMIPNVLVYYSVEPFAQRFKRKGGKAAMFTSGVRFAMMSLYSLPLFWTLFVVFEWIYLGWIVALCHAVLLVPSTLFGLHYIKEFKTWMKQTKFFITKKKNYDKLNELLRLRNDLFLTLDNNLKI